MKSMLRTSLATALAALLTAAGQTTQAASSTWNGTVSTAWTNAANWSPGIPDVGGDVVIANTTANNMSLSDSRTIGSMLFGDTGTRNSAFEIRNTAAGNSLTLTNGFAAYGTGGALATREFFYVPVIIANDQIWNIGGSAGTTVTDAGIRLRERATGVQNPLTLTGTLIKTGSGQLSLVGQNVGNGNIVVNQGSLKLNAGGTTLLTVGGTGSITANGASIMLSKNSGTFNITKAFVMNAGSTLQFGSGSAQIVAFGMPISWNGATTLGYFSSATQTNSFTNSWSGNAAITFANQNGTTTGFLHLTADNTGLSGSFNHTCANNRVRFLNENSSSAGVAWSLNVASGSIEAFGPANINLGSLAGSAGTVRNSNPAAVAATVTVGALNTDTTFGGVLADDVGTLGLIKVGSGTLTLTGNNTLSGGIALNNGSLLLQGAAASAGSGSITVAGGTTFGGSGSTLGAVNVQASGKVVASGGTGAPALTVGSLTLGSGGGDATTTDVNVYLGGKFVASGGLTVNGLNTVNITGAAPAVGTYDLIQHPGTIGGAGFAGFKLGALPYGVAAHLQNGATAVQLVVDAITVEASVWTGAATGTWNLTGTLDWKGVTSGTPQSFHNQDVTYFDGSAPTLTANIVADVTPSVVNVSGGANHTFTGTGSIIGLAALTKDGAGTLIVANSNAFTGGTFITNGTVQIGNAGTSGYLASAIQNDASLTFNRTDAFAVPGPVSGTGTVEQKGTGMTTLGGANTYEGLTTITSGTLAAGTGTAFGNTNLGVTVAAGATLDVNSQALGMEPVTATSAGVGGAGAIVNNGPGDSQSATRFVTLSGDTTFGGARRWDVRNPNAAGDLTGGTHAYLHGNGHNLTKVSSNVVAFIQVGDTALGNIDLQGGTLTFSRSTQPGIASGTLAIWPGATLQFHRLNEYMVNPFNKVITMTNATLAVEGSGLTNDLTGPITLTGSNVVTVPAATGLNLQGAMNGPGSLNHVGPNLLVISGNANYTGGTTVNGSILEVDGTLGVGAAISTLAASTLTGTGVISGPVTVPSGSTIMPGISDFSGTGTLGVGSLVLQAGSTTRMKINTDYANNDRVNAATTVTYGGTLVLTNLGFTAYAPASYKIFNAASYSGTFASLVPATPGLGLLWDTNTLATDGTLRIIVQPTPRPLLVLSVSALLSNMINVVFDTEVNQATALDPNNYTISTGQHVSYGVAFSPTNMQLYLDAPLTAPVYTVQVKNVKDLAYVPNIVATTNVPGRFWNFLSSESILITNGYAFAFADKIKIYADGTDIFGTSDQFQYVYKEITGDFDVSVCLESFRITDPAAKAGLMAREIVNPGAVLSDDRHYMSAAFTPDPTRNNNFVEYREANGGTTLAPGAPRPGATYPTNWLRLKRTGSVMEGFCGPNGLDWTPMTAVDSATNAAGAYPATVRLGLAVTSHNAAQTTEAVFHTYGTAKVRPALTIALSGSDVILSWPTTGLGWTLQASPSLTAPDADWQPIPGTAAVTSKTLPLGQGNRFFRLVQ